MLSYPNNKTHWKPFLFRLQQRIKHWTKPATLSLIAGVLSDLTRSRADLIVENALLRQQMIILHRQVKRPVFTNRERFRLVLLAAPGSGNKPFTLFNQTHFCVGIESYFVSIGGGNRRASRTSPRFHLRPSRSSGRWPRKIAYGERSGSGESC